MKPNYRFRLDARRPTRLFVCPQCGKKTFKRYIDTETDELLVDHIGRCNREINCGYHFSPGQYFRDHPTLEVGNTLYRAFPTSNIQTTKPDTFSTIPLTVFERSLTKYSENNFASFLSDLFELEIRNSLLQRFKIGTSRFWPGATVFWQIDILGNIRTGKVMLFDQIYGKRIKKPFNHINWVHSVLKVPDFQLRQCLFGEHQLAGFPDQKTVAIVESEKTAILMSAILPDYVWLATGGLQNLNPDIFACIKRYKIQLFPDLGGFSVWEKKADELNKTGFDVQISGLLERYAQPEDIRAGFDLADYFVQRDLDYGWAIKEEGYPVFWDYELNANQKER